MPTENEKKYLIRKDCEPAIERNCKVKQFISQGYMVATRGVTVRVRKCVVYKNNRKNKINYFYTFKINSNNRCIEIETELSKRDFNDLWAVALNKLEKIRYIYKNRKEIWEVDFFKDYQNNTYFALAEIELPEGVASPTDIPDLINQNLLYAVPLTDNRFSNKLLSDAKYASDLLMQFYEGNCP